MSLIRETHLLDDIQKTLLTFFRKLSDTSPWDAWEYVEAYPLQEVLDQFEKPVIYFEKPFLVDKIAHQGGRAKRIWRCTIGAWDDRKTGGTEEINIISSQLFKIVEKKEEINDVAFNITLGLESYTGKKMSDMGIKLVELQGPREVFTKDKDEFRYEFDLYIKT